jgi:hypothetical protein
MRSELAKRSSALAVEQLYIPGYPKEQYVGKLRTKLYDYISPST